MQGPGRKRQGKQEQYMTGIRICGTGSYLPDHVVENEAFTRIVETSDEWIRTRTGISRRHIAEQDTCWSMGVKAAQRAIEAAGVRPEEIDLILFTTVTADYLSPSMSCIVQGEIGAVHASCIDIACACAGYVYALDMARRYLACGDIHTVLIVSSEMLSRATDFSDRSTCVLFGDGAGACVVQAEDVLFATDLGADGTGAHFMFGRHRRPEIPFAGQPAAENRICGIPAQDGTFYMDGKAVYKFATAAMPDTLRRCCDKAGIGLSDLDWVVPHQANIRIIQTAMKKLGLPMEKAWVNIHETANTSSASIPIALDEMIRAGRLTRGQKVGVAGFGAGLVYAGAAFSY